MKLIFTAGRADTRTTQWAPAARVASSAAAGGQLTLTCSEHEYSLSTDSADATHFPAGTKVQLVPVGPASASTSPYAGLTVDSQSGNDVVLTTDPVPGSLTGTWNLEYDDIAASTSTQRDLAAYIADDADNSTGNAAEDSYKWQGPPSVFFIATPVDYTKPYKKIWDTSDDEGEPMSVSRWVDVHHAQNNHLAYRSRQVLVQEHGNPYVTGSFSTADEEAILFGPTWIPVYGGSRGLDLILLANVDSGTVATVRAIMSNGPPTGESAGDFAWPDGGVYSVQLVLGAGDGTLHRYYDGDGEGSVQTRTGTPLRVTDIPFGGFWLTVVGAVDTSESGFDLYGICLMETALS